MAALHKSAPPGWRVHKPKGYVIRITNTEDGVRCDFLNIPPGSYAIAVIHNVNMDGALETNFRGVSKKGYGISNGVKGMIGDSSFSAASFLYDKKNLDMPISLRYRRLLLKIPIVIRNPDPSLSAMATCELLAHTGIANPLSALLQLFRHEQKEFCRGRPIFFISLHHFPDQ